MSKPKGRRVDLNITHPQIQEPKFWLTDGSKWSRSAAAMKLEQDGEVQDALPEGSTRSVIFRQVLALTPGDWNGWKDLWTVGLIAACARNHDRARPLQADHSRRAGDCHGKVLDLIHVPAGGAHPEKDALVALVAIMGDYAIERVEDGRWDQFSVGIWAAFSEENSFLEELSFTTFPACDDVKLLHQQENHEEEEGANVPKETKNKVLEGAGAQGQQPAEETVEAAKPADSDGGDLAELKAQLARQDGELAELRREAEEAKTLRLEAEVKGEILQLTREGYSTPATFEDEKAFLLDLNAEQRSKYFELRRKQPQSWRPGRESDPRVALSDQKSESAKGDADSIMASLK